MCRSRIVVFSSFGVTGFMGATGCVGGWGWSDSSSSLSSSCDLKTSARCVANAFSLSLCAHRFCVGKFRRRGGFGETGFRVVLIGFHIELS